MKQLQRTLEDLEEGPVAGVGTPNVDPITETGGLLTRLRPLGPLTLLKLSPLMILVGMMAI